MSLTASQHLLQDRDRIHVDVFVLEHVYHKGRLWAEGAPVDLVYNRLVDFSLGDAAHAAPRETYTAGAVVVSPNPRNHALLADKRNLILLSDRSMVESFGLRPELAREAAQVPRTVRVTADNANDLWSGRKRYFFKPASGHGRKAVYRGDKLARGVWQQVVGGDYVAQEFVPPGERIIEVSARGAQDGHSLVHV